MTITFWVSMPDGQVIISQQSCCFSQNKTKQRLYNLVRIVELVELWVSRFFPVYAWKNFTSGNCVRIVRKWNGDQVVKAGEKLWSGKGKIVDAFCGKQVGCSFQFPRSVETGFHRFPHALHKRIAVEVRKVQRTHWKILLHDFSTTC